MRRLLESEARAYADGQELRINRQLDGATLSAMISIGVLTAGVITFGFFLASRWDAPWIHFFTGTAGLFGLLLMVAGVGQVWKPQKRDDKPASSS
jgi:predicted phage tail protein